LALACWALTSALYIIVYFKTKFYADMGLQVYYLVISFYGWYIWLHPNKPGSKSMLPVAKIKWQWAFFLLVISVGLQIIIAWFLKNFTDSPVPWGDAFTTAFAITATWMLAQKY
jgi:nicotinamide mononucleotide transporter